MATTQLLPRHPRTGAPLPAPQARAAAQPRTPAQLRPAGQNRATAQGRTRSAAAPRSQAQAGFLLWVGIDPDDRSPHAAEIIELAETLGELARELLPTAETFTALSLDSSEHPTAPPADLGALRTRLAELEIIAHTPWADGAPASSAVPDFDIDLAPRVTVDLPARRVVADGVEQKMTYKEFELLAYLVTSAGRVVPRSELFSSVWRTGTLDAASRTIDVHIRRLRDKLGLHEQIITVRGAGYRFEATDAVTVQGA